MRSSLKPDVRRDWEFSDRYIPFVKEILGKHLFVVSSVEKDQKEATDLVLRTDCGDVAVRIRRPQYLKDYRYDITFRSHRDGSPYFDTEFQKIMSGSSRYGFYGFASPDDDTVLCWTLTDMDGFRATFGLNPLPYRKIDNHDGTFGRAYDLRHMVDRRPQIIIASSDLIPSIIVPVAKRESASEYWKRRMGSGS